MDNDAPPSHGVDAIVVWNVAAKVELAAGRIERGESHEF